MLDLQLALADELLAEGHRMLQPNQLPGRYGRVIRDLEQLIRSTPTLAVVAGGWAVWRHGFVGRVTQAVDVVIPSSNLDELLRVASFCGFDVVSTPSGVWPKLVHRETRIDVDFLPEGRIPGVSSRLAPIAIRHPRLYGAEMSGLNYIDLPGLIELKLGAGRRKDLADIVELIKVNRHRVPDIRESLAAVYPGYLAPFDELTAEADLENSDENIRQ